MENQPANDIEAKQKGPQTAGFLFTRFNLDKVPPTGLEPVRPCGQQILSLQRLPVPPQAQNLYEVIQYLFLNAT